MTARLSKWNPVRATEAELTSDSALTWVWCGTCHLRHTLGSSVCLLKRRKKSDTKDRSLLTGGAEGATVRP
jgi:hypothetical protein